VITKVSIDNFTTSAFMYTKYIKSKTCGYIVHIKTCRPMERDSYASWLCDILVTVQNEYKNHKQS
jgi:hypothetical protein